MDNYINLSQTSEMLGVSDGTVRNWVKHKYLFPLQKSKNIIFNYNEVQSLKENIINGNTEKLNKRANKRNSTKTFIPKEYMAESSNSNLLYITEYIVENKLETHKSIFFLSLNLLLKENLILNNSLKSLFTFTESEYKNIFLVRILENFHASIQNFSDVAKYSSILDFELPEQTDVLGLLYQSIKSEGDKSKEGSYYTPQNIVNVIVSEYVNENSKVLDPCCGTGQFLISASNYIENPSNIFGFDIDPIAVFISKINLIIRYKSFDFNPKIFQKDTLLESNYNTLFSESSNLLNFDLIMTNPPWGLHFEKSTLDSLKNIFPKIKSLESFSYFLSKSIDLLDEDGIISFILPESILNIKVHNDIREKILKNTSILKIVKLGRAFTNVFTNVIRIDLKKSNPKKNHVINIVANSSYYIEQDRFCSNANSIFDIDVKDDDKEILDKVFRFNHFTLKQNAEWALGIVTGNNKQFLSSVKRDGFEEIYKGKDVTKYSLSQAQNYICFEPNKFQQVAPIEKYRVKEKLIYKFISSKLVFAYDDKQKLTLNSANILIPHIKNYPIKVVLALLNSSLYQFIYFKKFNTIKVLRGNLEELPFPIFNNEDFEKIISLVDNVLQNKTNYSLIDNFIMKLFNITNTEQKYIFDVIS